MSKSGTDATPIPRIPAIRVHPALSADPEISLTPRFSGVLRVERANVNRFNGFCAAISAALDKARTRPRDPGCLPDVTS